MSPKGENSPLGQDRHTQKDTHDLLMVSAGVSILGQGVSRGITLLPWWCPGRSEDSWEPSRRPSSATG